MSVGEKEYLIEGLIAPSLTEAGYELVRVAIDGANEQRLQIMIERLDQRAISVDDCAHVSKIISALLELDDPITGYFLPARGDAPQLQTQFPPKAGPLLSLLFLLQLDLSPARAVTSQTALFGLNARASPYGAHKFFQNKLN